VSNATKKDLDYGWRLRGRVVTVLQDRSFDLSASKPSGSFLAPYCRDVSTLSSCLQCGACTATCGLSGEASLLPRREITYVQLGLDERLADCATIWNCYDCGDCSDRCPSGVRPGRVMAGLRHLAIERFACPAWMAKVCTGPLTFFLVPLFGASLLSLVIAATGSFMPQGTAVRYSAMLPHLPLCLLFFGVLAAAFTSLASSVRVAWRAFRRSGHRTRNAKVLLFALHKACLEVLGHTKFSSCEGRRLASWAHRGVLWGVLALLLVSAVAALTLATGGAYPLSFDHPLKVLANLGSIALVLGSTAQIFKRLGDERSDTHSTFFDWSFLFAVWLCATTGVALELLRFADLGAIAYPMYFAHLVIVLSILASLPFTKLAHGAYRLTAITASHYDAKLAEAPASSVSAPRRRSTSAPPSTVSTKETFLDLDQKDLSTFSDATLAAAYYKLRDESVPRGDRRHYPNIQKLYGSALEREKDRREIRALVSQPDKPEIHAWYERAASETLTWWIENHMVARHSLRSCMFCGMCTSVCPAAQYYEEYNPRFIVDVALSRDEERIEELLASDILWLCGQCGSCKARCTRDNSIMALVSSLRCLAEIKGFHLRSARGRQQYAARHLWGGNFWNRACSLYFRNPNPTQHPDFGPRHAQFYESLDSHYETLGASPDMDGVFGGRKVPPATLKELRRCVHVGGTAFLWNTLEDHAADHAASLGLSIDEYLAKVATEG
jgi:quinone-modifying oxidoreductase subunit QmoC